MTAGDREPVRRHGASVIAIADREGLLHDRLHVGGEGRARMIGGDEPTARQGYRGQPAADVDALRDILLRVSRMADELPEILEFDLNPVIALPAGHGCRIVDARITVGPA